MFMFNPVSESQQIIGVIPPKRQTGRGELSKANQKNRKQTCKNRALLRFPQVVDDIHSHLRFKETGKSYDSQLGSSDLTSKTKTTTMGGLI